MNTAETLFVVFLAGSLFLCDREKGRFFYVKYFDFYLCRCEWLYGAYLGRFWGFMAGCKAVAMGQVLPLG